MPPSLRSLVKGVCGLASVMLLQGCTRDPQQFRWGLSARALEQHPVVLLDARLTLPDGRTLAMARERPPLITGPPEAGRPIPFADDDGAYRHLPARLDLTWFAVRERGFRSGSVVLPYERLVALFGAGRLAYGSRRKQPYAELALCLAPKGRLGLFVWNRYDVMLVESFQVPAVAADTIALDEAQRAAVTEAVDADRGGRPPRPWEELTASHDLGFAFVSRAELRSGHLGFADGEQTWFDVAVPDSAPGRQDAGRRWPVPQTLEIFWRNRHGLEFTTRLDLSYDETRTQLLALADAGPITLTLTVDADRILDAANHLSDAFATPLCTCTLVAGGRSLPLERVRERSYWNQGNIGHH